MNKITYQIFVIIFVALLSSTMQNANAASTAQDDYFFVILDRELAKVDLENGRIQKLTYSKNVAKIFPYAQNDHQVLFGHESLTIDLDEKQPTASDLYAVDLRGKNNTPIITDQIVAQAIFNPTNPAQLLIVYSSYKIVLREKTQEKIIDLSGENPVWSADGRKIFFIKHRPILNEPTPTTNSLVEYNTDTAQTKYIIENRAVVSLQHLPAKSGLLFFSVNEVNSNFELNFFNTAEELSNILWHYSRQTGISTSVFGLQDNSGFVYQKKSGGIFMATLNRSQNKISGHRKIAENGTLISSARGQIIHYIDEDNWSIIGEAD